MRSPSPPLAVRAVRRASSLKDQSLVASSRSRSPRRASARPASEPPSPLATPRQDRLPLAPPVACKEEACFLSSWAIPSADELNPCTCALAPRYRELMRRFREKCAQVRQAHAYSSSLELRVAQLEAMGPRGAVRNRLLAAEAAAAAAEEQLRGEREQREESEAAMLALIESGQLEALRELLSAGKEERSALNME
ncbi:MAG: hypothetical protein SGPRY_003212, partial [Prymnesium sp.]